MNSKRMRRWLVVVTVLLSGYLIAVPQQAYAESGALNTLAQIIDAINSSGASSLPITGADITTAGPLFECLERGGVSIDTIATDCADTLANNPQAAKLVGGSDSWGLAILKAYIAIRDGSFSGVIDALGTKVICAVAQVMAAGVNICELLKELIALAEGVIEAVKIIIDAIGDAIEAVVCAVSSCPSGDPPEYKAYIEVFEPRICEGVAMRMALDNDRYQTFLDGVWSVGQSMFDCPFDSQNPWASYACNAATGACWHSGGKVDPNLHFNSNFCSRRYDDHALGVANQRYLGWITVGWSQGVVDSIPALGQAYSNYASNPKTIEFAAMEAIKAGRPRSAVVDYCTGTLPSQENEAIAQATFNKCIAGQPHPDSARNAALSDFKADHPPAATLGYIDRFAQWVNLQSVAKESVSDIFSGLDPWHLQSSQKTPAQDPAQTANMVNEITTSSWCKKSFLQQAQDPLKEKLSHLVPSYVKGCKPNVGYTSTTLGMAVPKRMICEDRPSLIRCMQIFSKVDDKALTNKDCAMKCPSDQPNCDQVTWTDVMGMTPQQALVSRNASESAREVAAAVAAKSGGTATAKAGTGTRSVTGAATPAGKSGMTASAATTAATSSTKAQSLLSPELTSTDKLRVGGLPVAWDEKLTISSTKALAKNKNNTGLCEFVIEYSIRNTGTMQAPKFQTTWTNDVVKGAWTHNWTALEPGTAKMERDLLLLKPGTNLLQLTIDEANQIKESSERNNKRLVRVEVTGSCGPASRNAAEQPKIAVPRGPGM